MQAYSFMRSLSVKSKQQLPYRDWELQAAEMEVQSVSKDARVGVNASIV